MRAGLTSFTSAAVIECLESRSLFDASSESFAELMASPFVETEPELVHATADAVSTGEPKTSAESLAIADDTLLEQTAIVAEPDVTQQPLTAKSTVAVPFSQTPIAAVSTTSDEPVLKTLAPVADALIRDGEYADQRFGTLSELVVKSQAPGSGYTRESYLSFDWSGLSGVAAGTLKLSARLSENVSTGIEVGVFAVDQPRINEVDFTWEDRAPSVGTQIGKFKVTGTMPSTFSIDVGSYVGAGRTSATFVLRATYYSHAFVSIGSREASANQPELQLQQGDTAPVPKTPLRIMPLGDSITLGINGGYRAPLYHRLASSLSGRPIDFVGTATNGGVGGLPEREHEGHGGYRINDIIENLDGDNQRYGNNGGYWLSGHPSRGPIYPDLILLHIGTNDVPSIDQYEMLDRLETLLYKLTSMRPNARVLVSDLVPRADVRESRSEAYNAMIPSLVSRFQAMGRKVSFVDMHDKVSVNDLYDSLHPNDAGQAKMAVVWEAAIRSVV